MNVDNQSPIPEKLPCRGCTATCPHRDRCEGKPWRLPRSRSLENGARSSLSLGAGCDPVR